jgi:hypothetical protein
MFFFSSQGEAFAALFDQENSNFGKAVYSLE